MTELGYRLPHAASRGEAAVLLVPGDRAQPVALAVCAAPALTRVPVVRVRVTRADRVVPSGDRHIRVCLPGRAAWAPLADVLAEPAGDDPRAQAADLARRHPGALVVAVYAAAECWMRVGGRARAVLHLAARPGGGEIDPPWPVWASAVHAWLAAGLPPAALLRASAHALRDGGARVAVRGMRCV